MTNSSEHQKPENYELPTELQELQGLLDKADNTRSAIGVLFDTKALYPDWTDEDADDYQEELAPFQNGITPEIMKLLVADKDQPKAQRLLRRVYGLYASSRLAENGQKIEAYQKDDTKSGFWSKDIAPLKDGEEIISYIKTFSGDTMLEKYITFRNKVVSGGISQNEIEKAKITLDSVERVSGRLEANQLFNTVRLIHDLGFKSVSEFIEVMIGEPVDKLQTTLASIKDSFAKRFLERGKIDYLDAFLLSTQNTDMTPTGANTDTIAQLWNAMGMTEGISNVRFHQSDSIGNPAYFYQITDIPTFVKHYESLNNSAVWNEINNGSRLFILLRELYDNAERDRILFHEAGHASEGILHLAQGGTLNNIQGRPITATEIFSQFGQMYISQQDFLREKEAFLTARYIGLIAHQMNVLLEAERVVIGNMDSKLETTFYEAVEESYQDNLGGATNSNVPKGRAITDSLDLRKPLSSIAYAFGTPLAIVLHRLVEKENNTPEQKRKILNTAAIAAAQFTTVEAFLKQLEVSEADMLTMVNNYFNPNQAPQTV